VPGASRSELLHGGVGDAISRHVHERERGQRDAGHEDTRDGGEQTSDQREAYGAATRHSNSQSPATTELVHQVKYKPDILAIPE